MKPLTQVQTGKTYIIKWMIAGKPVTEFFEAMNLEVGMPIKVIADYYGSLLVNYQGHTYGMSDDVAYRIKVASL